MQTEDYGWHSICGSGSLHSISIEYLQLSYLKEGESILVISNGKVLLSDPYQFDKIYSIQLLQ